MEQFTLHKIKELTKLHVKKPLSDPWLQYFTLPEHLSSKDLKAFRGQNLLKESPNFVCWEVTTCTDLCLPLTVRPFEVQSKAAFTTTVWKSEKSWPAGTGSHTAGRSTWRHTKQGIHITTSPGMLAQVLWHLTGKALESTLAADGCI